MVGQERIPADAHSPHSGGAKRDGVFIIDYEAGIQNSANRKEVHESMLMEFYEKQWDTFTQVSEAVEKKRS